jgi:hypothetical protein
VRRKGDLQSALSVGEVLRVTKDAAAAGTEEIYASKWKSTCGGAGFPRSYRRPITEIDCVTRRHPSCCMLIDYSSSDWS